MARPGCTRNVDKSSAYADVTDVDANTSYSRRCEILSGRCSGKPRVIA